MAFGGGRGWSGGYGKYGGRWGHLEEMHEQLHREKTDKPSGGPAGTAT